MDIPTQTFVVGAGLTNAALESAFLAVTGHQITRNDFSTTFQPGADIDLDGFGISGQRHLNGVEAWATKFGTGDDADAIQRAVNFVQASSPGRGVVYITPLSGGARWDIDAKITLYSGISIVGRGRPVLNKNVGSPAFDVSNTSECVVRGLVVDGNNTSGALVYGTDVSNLLVCENVIGGGDGISVGAGDALGSRLISGPLVDIGSGAAVSSNIEVRGNHCYEQNEMVHVEDALNVIVVDNRITGTTRRTSAEVIRLAGVYGAVVSGNWVDARADGVGASSGPSNCIALDAGTLSSTCRAVEISDNYCIGGAGHQCYVSDSTNVRIVDNTFVNAGESVASNTYDAIHITASSAGGTDGVTIRDNLASNLPESVSPPVGGGGGCRYGIRVESNPVGITIMNNFLENIDTAAATNPATHYVCGTCGISVVSTTRIMRRWNWLTIGGPSGIAAGCVNVAGYGTGHFAFTIPGLRGKDAAGADANRDNARHDQFIGALLAPVYTNTLDVLAAAAMVTWKDMRTETTLGFQTMWCVDNTGLALTTDRIHTLLSLSGGVAPGTPSHYSLAYELLA